MRVDDNSTIPNSAGAAAAWPGLPKQEYTISHWLGNARNSHHLDRRTTPNLPATADLVVIGSGLSGVMLAYFLLTAEDAAAAKPKSIVLLEARQFCHGATGRNGGHCRPDTYLGYPAYKKAFGAAEAMRLIDLELDTLNLLDKVVKDEDIDCDFWRGKGMDVFMSESITKVGRDALDEYERDGGTIRNDWVGDQAQALKDSRVKGTVATCTYPAGSLYPFKLASALLDICLDRGLNFQSTTPVISVDGSPTAWKVHTNRGAITSSKVVYCTNAYTATILPELKTTIVPIRGHCAAITPTKAFSGQNMIKTSQIIRWGAEQLPPEDEGDFEYLIQRPSDGKIILGGKSDDAYMDNIDDSCTFESSTAALRQYMRENYVDWGTEQVGEGLNAIWTGIMGITENHVPIVSPVPHKPGQFINAGHNGHGMARIARCSQGLAKLILAGEGAAFEASGLPTPLQWTDQTLPKDLKWFEVGRRRQSMGQTTSANV